MVKILIADDHAISRRGLKQILAEEFYEVIFGEASNAQELIRNIHEQGWDVVILDIAMLGIRGLDVLRELKHIRPKLPVLILSSYTEEQYAIRSLRAGAFGYITKRSTPEELVKAIRKVMEGRRYISLSLVEKLATTLGTGFEQLPHEMLSNREYQVACMIASGKSVKEIAEKLSLCIGTIRTYRVRIMKKMDVKSNAELIHYLIRNRLAD